MKSFSKWFCSSNSTKNMLVKIVHPGGHVELHDRPILAAELLSRNPKCCVAHPTVFQKPYAAVVSPETTLALGRKYYVVPLGTIRKLQLKHPRPLSVGEKEVGGREGSLSTCWSFKSGEMDERGASNSRCLRSMSSVIGAGSGQEMKIENNRKGYDCRDASAAGTAPGRLTLVSCDDWQPALQSVIL